jgi:hypothetical protein
VRTQTHFRLAIPRWSQKTQVEWPDSAVKIRIGVVFLAVSLDHHIAAMKLRGRQVCDGVVLQGATLSTAAQNVPSVGSASDPS